MQRLSSLLNDYECIYGKMLHPVSSGRPYESIDEYANELEFYVLEELQKNGLEDFIRYPESNIIFELEADFETIVIPELPTDQTGHEYILAKISAQTPLSCTEKPSGIIFNDFSFFQVEELVAWRIQDKMLYLLKYAYHYGRVYADQVEKYFFRHDKESDHEYREVNGSREVRSLDYKPIHHFHGNSRDPHFPEEKGKEIADIIKVLRINLPRLIDQYGECKAVPLPEVGKRRP